MSVDERILSGGTQGPSGLSAYGVAVKNGFEGTEEEWLASLVGTGAELLAQLTTNPNSKVRLVGNPNGGVDLALWNPDTNSFQPIRATGEGAEMTTTFFEYP